jgi:hypothetical protein
MSAPNSHGVADHNEAHGHAHHGATGTAMKVAEEAVEFVTSAVTGAALWSWLGKTFSHEIVKAPAEKVGKMVGERAEETMRDNRVMIMEKIHIKLRASKEKVNGKNIADALRERMHKSKHAEYKVWKAMGKVLESLTADHNETHALELLGLMARTNQRDFDKWIDDLDHNPIEQIFAMAKPYLKAVKNKLIWADAKFRQLLVLIIGSILVNFIGAAVIGHFHDGVALWKIIAILVVLVIASESARRKLPKGFFGGLPPWSVVISNSAIAVGVTSLILLFAPNVTPMEFISWSTFAVTGLFLFYIFLGQHPLYFIAARFFTEVPYVGRPVKAVFEGFGAVISALMLFHFFFPFGNLDRHARLLVFAALITCLWMLFLILKKKELAALATLVLFGIFAYGFLAGSRWNSIEEFASNISLPSFSRSEPAATVQATVVTTTKTETVTAPVQEPTKVAKKVRRERRNVVGTSADTDHDYQGQVPATHLDNESPVLYGEYQGFLTQCANGDLPTYQYSARRANMCVRTPNGIIRVKYNGLDHVDIRGNNMWNIANLEQGMELKFRVVEGLAKEVMAR